jgi:hypothetical protein
VYPAAAALLLMLAGCASAPPSGPPLSPSSQGPGSGDAATPPGSEPTLALPEAVPAQGEGVVEDPGRYSFLCRSSINVPDVTLSSLAEVWASPGYLRISSCTARYEGNEPFVPTAEEAKIIAAAEPGVAPQDGLAAYLSALSLCTRVSDEAASAIFGTAGHQMLLAASQLCPKGPQGKIIALWAEGGRAGDGQHAVGDSIAAGTFQLRKTPPAECAWTINTPSGQTRAAGGGTEGQQGISLVDKDVLDTQNCGIWEKAW